MAKHGEPPDDYDPGIAEDWERQQWWMGDKIADAIRALMEADDD